MATFTVGFAHHGTTVLNVIDTINFADVATVLTVNNNGGAALYLTLGGSDDMVAVDPVVGADDTYVVMANSSERFQEPYGIKQVKVISAVGVSYDVQLENVS